METIAFLYPITANDKKYFTQAKFNQDHSCVIKVTDTISAWECSIDKEELEGYASETNTEFEEYCTLMKNAFSGLSQSQTFDYNINEKDDGKLLIEWKKVQKDVKFCLGSVELGAISDTAKAMEELLMECCHSFKVLNSSKNKCNDDYAKLETKYDAIVKQLEKCQNLKQGLESDLLTKFVLVINEKKGRIRMLQQQLSDISAELDGSDALTPAKEKLSEIIKESLECRSNMDSKGSNFDEDSDDSGPVLPKRRKIHKPAMIKTSPVKIDINKTCIPAVNFPSDINTTSSDSTVDVNDLIEDA